MCVCKHLRHECSFRCEGLPRTPDALVPLNLDMLQKRYPPIDSMNEWKQAPVEVYS
jgi:hypothetical protein